MLPRLKVCCIASVAEARLAIACGADALGLVGPMPSGPGTITDERAAEIARAAPPAVATFLLTSESRADGIADHVERVAPTVVQIVRHIKSGEYPRLRERLPGIKLVQVIHVVDEASIELARTYANLADALLLDSGRPSAEVAELGGTGRTHDWGISRRIVEAVRVPVFLAGGLTPANIREALAAVRPFGFDLCTGVRRDGHLAEDRLRAFTQALWGPGQGSGFASATNK
jgi:phosphoribosylanthranilate isomerase